MEENGKRIEETGSQRGVSLSRRIVKAMGVFGGVQVLTMLFSLIRIKLLAIFVGPAGVGLLGILNSTLDMTYSATSLSLRNSSVRDIAAEGDERHRRSIIAVLRRWSLLVGALGLLVVLVASPLFSLSAFKSTAYTWAFLAVAVVMMFNALADGEKAVLQGTGQLRYLASSQVWGAALGLAACIPLFYFLKDDGIVPAVIACSALAALAMWCYGRKAVPYSLRADVPWRDTWRVGRSFVKLGFFMMLSTFMGFLANYLFVMWLTHSGGVNTVGLYQAGYTIVDKYAGLIFTAMAVEYYPRLACVVADKLKAAEYVSRQIGVTMVVMLPVVVIMMLLASPIVAILYSEKFMAAVPLVVIALSGSLFRVVSWSMAYYILARGSGKLYFVTETLSAIATLVVNIAGYHYGGLAGLGYAYVGGQIAYVIITFVCCRFYYQLRLGGKVWLVTAVALAASGAVMWAVTAGAWWLAIAVAVIASAASAVTLWKMIKGQPRTDYNSQN